ncbi:7531_t:CDS:1, partial [Entrophospora sp. SA101]
FLFAAEEPLDSLTIDLMSPNLLRCFSLATIFSSYLFAPFRLIHHTRKSTYPDNFQFPQPLKQSHLFSRLLHIHEFLTMLKLANGFKFAQDIV